MLVEIETHRNFPSSGGFKTFLKYYPSRYDVSSEYENNRQAVYSFKGGEEIPQVDQLFADAIKHLKQIKNNIPFWICPIPSSTLERTIARYQNFCLRVSNLASTNNGYNLLKPIQDRPEIHIGQKRVYDNVLNSIEFSSNINGKNIILVDDVITTGKSYKIISDHLQSIGARSVFGLMLAKTYWPSPIIQVLDEGDLPNEPPPNIPPDLEYREPIDDF